MYLHNHLYGLCSKYGDHAIVHIPKNASRTINKIFGGRIVNFNSFTPNTFWIPMREPVGRWRSGILENLFLYPENEEFIFDNISQIEFDEHTTPQTKFFEQDGPNRYFDISKPWLELENELNIRIPSTYRVNHMPEYLASVRKQKELSDRVDTVLTESFKNKLKEYYYDDVVIFNNIGKHNEF